MKLQKLKEKLFPLQLTKRLYIGTIIFTLIPTIILSIIIPVGTVKAIKAEKEKQLAGVTDRLRKRLTDRMKVTYQDILTQNGAANKTRNEQVMALHNVLQPIIDDISPSFPELAMGYYSSDLDAILAIKPQTKPFKVRSVSHSLPYFNIYKTGKPQFGQYDTSKAWDGKPIYWYIYPIFDKGRIVGHVWASVKTETIYMEALWTGLLIFLTWLLIAGILIMISLIICKRINNELINFADSVVKGDKLNNRVIPELKPINDIIKEHTSKIIKQAKDMEVNERKYRAIFNSTFQFIGLMNTEGTLIEANQTLLEFAGVDLLEVINRPFWEARWWSLSEETREKLKDAVKRASDGEFVRYEVDILGAGNRVATIDFSIKPVFDEDGNVILLLPEGRDVSEKIKIQKEMVRLDQLNLVGQMACGIGHEVRNPMTSIRGFLQLLGNRETDTRKIEYYDLMIEELDRANSIITEFLSLAKDRAVKLKPASLNSVIIALYPLLTTDAMKQDKVIVFSERETPDILINEKEIRQLILNLVRNGLEAMRPGGVLTIGTYLEDDGVVLFIEDEGTGIPSEIYNKLGTPFVTSKDNGTGLGLSVCYSIAHKHNAKIWVKTGSTGTTFYVKFMMPAAKVLKEKAG